MLASLLILSNLCNYSRPHAPTVGNTEMISCAITAPDSFRCQPFWKTDAHLHADTYSPQKWAEPVPPGLSQKLYLSGQRSKTRLSIERKGLRPSAIPFWDTMPRRVPDGTPIRVISGDATTIAQRGARSRGAAPPVFMSPAAWRTPGWPRQQPLDAKRPRSSGEPRITAGAPR